MRNSGLIVKDAGSTAVQLGLATANSGTIRADTGTLNFGGGSPTSVLDGGTWTSAGGTVALSGGSWDLGTNTNFNAHVSGATVTARGLASSGTLRLTSGTLTFPQNTYSSVDSVTMTGGTLTGAGTMYVSNALSWTGGTMSGNGVTSLGTPSVSTISPSGMVILDQRTLSNRGRLTWTSGTLRGDNGALLDNLGILRPNAESADMQVGTGATPIVSNKGTMAKTVGTGTTWVRWALANSGFVFANTGTLNRVGPVIDVGAPNSESAGGGSPDEPNRQSCCSGKPVDSATGNQFEVQTDLAVGGRGLGLQAVRTYNSQSAAAATTAGAYGYGWTGSYSDHLVVNSTYRTATVHHANGSTVVFSDYGAGDYRAAPWVQSTLARNADGTFTFTLPSQVRMRFASDGKLLDQRDRNDNATTMSYTNGRLTSVTDPAGRSLSYEYDAGGMVAAITDPAGLTVTYSYTGGHLTSVRYSAITQAQWAFGYDAAHQLTSMTDARGHTTTTAYDASRRVISQTDALNRTRTWSYTPNTTTITNPGGDVTRQVFEDGQPVQITRALGTSVEATQTLTYNAIRALSSVTDASGRTTTYGYDAAGNKTTVTTPGARTSPTSYNATRDVTSSTTPSGKTTIFAYDAHGNLTSLTRTLKRAGQPDVAQTSTFGYDNAGNRTSATDPLQHTTTCTYDTRGNMTSRTDPLEHTTSWTYDDASRVMSVTTPRGHESGADPEDFTTMIQRDSLGRPIGSSDGLNRHTSTTYDALGNVVEQMDAEGRTTTAVYDAENQPTSTTRPGGATSHTSYDPNGQVQTRTDANGHVTTYTRDALSRITKQTDPLAHETTFAYDLSGRLTTKTNAAGKTTSYTYTPPGELSSIDYENSGTHDIGYTYDADGQRTAMTDATGQSTFSYDSLGRLTSVTDGDNQTVGYAYDLGDRQTTVTYPGGDAVARSYDAADRLTSITDWLGNTTSYDYDADDNQTTVTYPASTNDVEHNDYDNAGRLLAQTLTHDGTQRARFAYAHNNADQLTSQTDTGELQAAHAYDYDTQGRLIADGPQAFDYDDAGNLTELRETTLSFDAADRLTTATHAGTVTSYDYDLAGNRTRTTPSTGGQIVDYAYDQADQLTSVDDHTGTPISYTYAGDGLRASKTKNSYTSRFTWDRSAGLPVLLAKDATRYVYDQDGLAIEQIAADDTVSYLHHDRLGSTRLVTDANGETQATYAYDAYGNRTTTDGSSSVPFGYTGQYTDTDTGLIYLRARYYDPHTGQFITRDPIEGLTLDPYRYAGNDPINNTDQSGLDFLGIGKAVNHGLDTLYDARREIEVLGGIATAGVCVAAAPWCATTAIVALTIQSAVDIYGHARRGQGGSLVGQLAGNVGLTLLTMAPAARIARAGGVAYERALLAGATEAAAASARANAGRLGSGGIGVVNRTLGEMPAVGLNLAQYCST
jgi:RHS repeat-associated protein